MIGYYLSIINEICYSTKIQIFLPTKHTLRLIHHMRHPTMQMQNASPRPLCICHAALQQVMQRGRQTVFGGERKCKNTLHLSSDAKCTICWSSQLLSFVPFPVHTRQSTFCLSKMHIPVGTSLRYCWFFFQTNSFRDISNSICQQLFSI